MLIEKCIQYDSRHTHTHTEKPCGNVDVHLPPHCETPSRHQSFLLAICEKAFSKQWSITFDITTDIVQGERQWLMFWSRLIYANALHKSHVVVLFYFTPNNQIFQTLSTLNFKQLNRVLPLRCNSHMCIFFISKWPAFIVVIGQGFNWTVWLATCRKAITWFIKSKQSLLARTNHVCAFEGVKR